MNDKPVLGLLTGDGAGVGPEIIAKLAVGKFFLNSIASQWLLVMYAYSSVLFP